MRRDAIFYKLFQQTPSLIFELLDAVPETAERYRFESVTVKEPTFLIDGVFLPPADQPPGVVIFAEVQMQPNQRLIERLFGELMTYFYRNRDAFSDWQAVLIYASRSMEQNDTYPYRALLNSDQVHRIYLNELGAIEELPLGVAAMVLTIENEASAPEKARMLLQRADQELADLPMKQGIIEMVSTIIAYMFTTLSRQEIDEMLGTKMEDVRVFREAKEEKAQEIALNFLKQGLLSVEAIAQGTGLTIEQVQQLQAQVEEK
ncbi:MAG: Rpn family recombination-promoting nuclease/putative transposase [Alkalinema sp. RU_4_3]|nr:Rpn family recombination-promoting nuclease/putative transposase [Alkalinema sp. RU_4_3]